MPIDAAPGAVPMRPTYCVRRTNTILLALDWYDPAWAAADTLRAADFHPQFSAHRPLMQARMLHDGLSIQLAFVVENQLVRCVHTEYQSPVYLDSCVELYVEPKPQHGYFNFEVNCGGALLLHHNE